MTGATSTAAGAAGRVPAPAAGAQDYFLKGDGTWAAAGGNNVIVSSTQPTDNNCKLWINPS